ncbi:MAG: phosphoglycerate dehydrogenase [Candidatus Sumerlaeia bacterium]|nr:phosphoglycerate dehydrogenase [Candidatus Sumerlaeia bacterium]
MPRILVSDKISDEGLAILRSGGPDFEVVCDFEITPEDLVRKIGDFDALVIRSRTTATKEVIEAGRRLKVIGRAGVGLDNVDIAAATRCGVIVMNTPEGNTVSTAEHACALMIALAKNLAETTASMRAGKWEKKRFKGTELRGKVLGVIGLGRIGTIVARRMQAFGMSVLAYDPFKTPEAIANEDCTPATVDEIVAQADFITLHTPKTPETANLISAERIAKMKRGARLINCARGGLVDEVALAKALEGGHLAGAALDVFNEEPPPADHPILKLGNVVLSPHLGAATAEAQEMVASDVAKQIVDALTGGPVINAVNYPSVDPAILPRISPFMELAEHLGTALSQLIEGAVKELRVTCAGDVTEFPTKAITLKAIRGFLKRTTDVTVNFVNAIPLVEARGVKVVTLNEPNAPTFDSLITLDVTLADGSSRRIAGTIFGQREPRIVQLDGQRIDASPEGTLILITNRDVPGVVGSVGMTLAKHQINIAQMNLGVDDAGRRALLIVKIDGQAAPSVLGEIGALPNILSVQQLAL